MRVEVDQSGKVERTQVNTALAFSNSESSAVLILAVEKRSCIEELRKRGYRGFEPYLRLFVVGVFLLIRDHLSKITFVVIDVENAGHEKATRRLLLRQIRKVRQDFPPDAIVFEQIGRKSPAHKKALAVFQKKEQPARRLRARELLRLID